MSRNAGNRFAMCWRKRWSWRRGALRVSESSLFVRSSLRQEVETLLASSDDVRSSFLQSSALRVTLSCRDQAGRV